MSNQTGKWSGKPTGGRPKGLVGANGQVALSQLRKVETQPHLGNSSAAYLYGPCARAFDAMVRAAARDGVRIRLVVGYRDLAQQKVMRRIWCGRGECGGAAVPGTSKHGVGVTIDLKMNAAVEKWMRNNAVRFGWDRPTWADDNQGIEEDWHFQYIDGFVLPDEIKVVVAGEFVADAGAFRDSAVGNPVWIEVRPVAETLGVLLDFPEGPHGIIVDGPKTPPTTIDFRNLGGDGYVRAREFAKALGIESTLSFQNNTLKIG